MVWRACEEIGESFGINKETKSRRGNFHSSAVCWYYLLHDCDCLRKLYFRIKLAEQDEHSPEIDSNNNCSPSLFSILVAKPLCICEIHADFETFPAIISDHVQILIQVEEMVIGVVLILTDGKIIDLVGDRPARG